MSVKIKILGASAPTWGNEEQTIINLQVQLSHMPGQYLPFSANKDDKAEHGRELWTRAMFGEFGEIAPFKGMTAAQERMATFPRRQRLELERLEKLITPLQRAAKFGIATEAEEVELTALELQTVAVMRCQGPDLPARV